MKYAHIINYFNSAPWAILPEKLHAILSLIELRAAGLTLTENEIQSRISGPIRTDDPDPEASAGAAVDARSALMRSASAGSIAVLPIMGTIAHRAGMLHRASGGMSVEQFSQDFRAAIRDPDIKAIILDIDSPGGSTSGIEEISDEVFAARSQKRIIASVNSLAASAAYWIASSAHEIAVTPSGQVGSIGIIGVHMDRSEQASAEGVKVTLIHAGEFKTEGNEFEPLTAAARSHLQGIVDDRMAAFVKAVARGRKVSQATAREGFGKGRLLTAKDAESAKMVDSIESIDQLLSRTITRSANARRLAEASAWKMELGGPAGDGSIALPPTKSLSGVVPEDICSVIAPEGTAWTPPVLTDFTAHRWEDTSGHQRTNIAMHAAWTREMPPRLFSDVKFFHHDSTTGNIVPDAVKLCLAELEQSSLGETEKAVIEEHLMEHMSIIERRRTGARAIPALDPEKVALELLELG